MASSVPRLVAPQLSRRVLAGAPLARTMRVCHSLEGTSLGWTLKMAAERGLALVACAILK